MGSDYLFAPVGFLLGLGSVLDVGGSVGLYNLSPTPEMADRQALESDAAAVGADMRATLDRFASNPELRRGLPEQLSLGLTAD